MSLGDAFRRLGRIEAVRHYAAEAPFLTGEYAENAFAEVGEAMERYMFCYLYGAIEEMQNRQAEMQEYLIEAITESIKRGVREAVVEGVKIALAELQKQSSAPTEPEPSSSPRKKKPSR